MSDATHKYYIIASTTTPPTPPTGGGGDYSNKSKRECSIILKAGGTKHGDENTGLERVLMLVLSLFKTVYSITPVLIRLAPPTNQRCSLLHHSAITCKLFSYLLHNKC